MSGEVLPLHPLPKPKCRPWWPCLHELTPDTLPKPPAERVPRGCDAAGDVAAQIRCVWTAGGYGWERDYAVAVATCESGLDPNATGALGEVGLFQLRPEYHAWRWRGKNGYDPVVNSEAALGLRRDSGWGPWSCAR